MTTSSSSSRNPIIAGSFAGFVGTLLGYPLDTIRVHQATEQRTDGRGGLVATCRRLVRAKGVSGLFAGVSSPLFSLVVLNISSFGGYSVFSRWLGSSKTELVRANSSTSPWWTPEPRVALAGGLCGAMAALISTPFELVKVQMQLRGGGGARPGGGGGSGGAWGVAAAVAREGGVARGLYRGHFVNTLREIAFVSVYFGVYEHLKPALRAALNSALPVTTTTTTAAAGGGGRTRRGDRGDRGLVGAFASAVLTPLAGGAAGASAWLVSYPLDCVKVNLQGRAITHSATATAAATTTTTEGAEGGGRRGGGGGGGAMVRAAGGKKAAAAVPDSGGAMAVARQLIRTRGVVGLYTGLGASVLRAFLVSGTRFSAYEVAMWGLAR